MFCTPQFGNHWNNSYTPTKPEAPGISGYTTASSVFRFGYPACIQTHIIDRPRCGTEAVGPSLDNQKELKVLSIFIAPNCVRIISSSEPILEICKAKTWFISDIPLLLPLVAWFILLAYLNNLLCFMLNSSGFFLVILIHFLIVFQGFQRAKFPFITMSFLFYRAGWKWQG